MAVFALLYSAFLALVGWAMVCNARCYRQQLGLIDQIAKANEATGYRESFWYVIDAVSYDQHFWRLITFRDPWSVYPPELAEVRKLSA